MRCKRCDKWFMSFSLNDKQLCKECAKAVERHERVLSNHSTRCSSRRIDDDSFLPISPTFDTNTSSSHHTSSFEPGGGSFGGGGSSGSWDSSSSYDSGSSDSGSSDCGSCGGD